MRSKLQDFMKKNDFVFCIGFAGEKAIVDRKLASSCRSLGVQELFAKGLYKNALAHAIYEQNHEDLAWFCTQYAFLIGKTFLDIDAVKRCFGVFKVFEDIHRTSYL